MKKIVIVSSVLAISVIGGGALLYTKRDSVGTKMENSQVSPSTNQQSVVDSIPKSPTEQILEGYTGDEFDRYFIANMIAHHQGAVDMAKLAQSNAQHTELKTLANDIISAQTKEIDDMLAWQKDWGYPSTSGEMMMDHSGMTTKDEMGNMSAELASLSSDAFDKKFIELMIEHHESAVSMARPGEKNAGHKEVKALTKAIIAAQTTEITQLKQWQKDWGYRN